MNHVFVQATADGGPDGTISVFAQLSGTGPSDSVYLGTIELDAGGDVVAIDNAALYRAVKREALEKNLLYEIGKKLSSSLALDEVLREILSSLKRVVDYDAGGIYLVDPDTGAIDSVFAVGYDPDRESRLHLKVGQGLVGHVADSGEPVIVPDVAADDRYYNARPATRSEVTVPVILDDRVIGGINLESDSLNAYNGHHVSALSAFA